MYYGNAISASILHARVVARSPFTQCKGRDGSTANTIVWIAATHPVAVELAAMKAASISSIAACPTRVRHVRRRERNANPESAVRGVEKRRIYQTSLN